MTPKPTFTDHLNFVWSSLIISELIKNGIHTFFVSPGNRNAPLLAILAHEKRASVKICPDERGAAYRALGHAKASKIPGVLVCTSGTASANYYPAGIEASREDIPLIILSADRPPELIGSDANQTIVQDDLYGRYCRDTLLLPPPDTAYPLEALLAKIDYLLANRFGPVHLNCPFRDPLSPGPSKTIPPTHVLKKAETLMNLPGPFTSYPRKKGIPDLSQLLDRIGKTKRGLVIVGRLDTSDDSDALEKLLRGIDWPVYCDIASSLKSALPPDRQIFSLDHPESIRLIRAYKPDTILQFGTGLVSKHYYASILPQSRATLIQISPRTGLRDPAHRVNLRIDAPVSSVADELLKTTFPKIHPKLYFSLMMSMGMLSVQVKQEIAKDVLSFAFIASTLVEAIPEGEGLFVGNSIAIRAFDASIPAYPRKRHVISNRGVSGIEGNIATCVGFAEASNRRVTAVIGDMSFLHDMNSLIFLKQSIVPVILVVVNNGGGRIFERLPISEFPDILHPLMTTPHGMTFRHSAAQFDIPYVLVSKPQELSRAYQKTLKRDKSSILEVVVSPKEDLRIFKAMQQVRLPKE